MFLQVPDAKSLIPRCRDQNQTATGCEAQISHDILVAGKSQKQQPWRGNSNSQWERGHRVCWSLANCGAGSPSGLYGNMHMSLPGPIPSQKRPTCLHLPNLDLPIVEARGKDQARDVWHLGMVACPELPAGWRRPRAKGQAPDNLPTVQSLLLGAALPF